MDLPLWKKAFFINRCSNSLKRLLFYPEREQTLFLDLCLINRKDEKTLTFWPKLRTNPFEKNAGFLKSYNENVTNLFVGVFCIKRKVNKITSFLPKPWTNPFGKIEIQRFFLTNVFIVQKGLFSLSNVKNRFFTINFHYLLHGDTGVYRVLQGVTGGYKELQGVIGVYRGLQQVTDKRFSN